MHRHGADAGTMLKLPPLRHPVKRGMALEGPHIGRKQAEADRAAAVAVVDAVDQRRQFLAPVVVGREQVRLVLGGGHQVEQNDATLSGLVRGTCFQISSRRASRKPVSRVS